MKLVHEGKPFCYSRNIRNFQGIGRIPFFESKANSVHLFGHVSLRAKPYKWVTDVSTLKMFFMDSLIPRYFMLITIGGEAVDEKSDASVLCDLHKEN